MLIVFTDHFDTNIFKKFNSPSFGADNNDALIILNDFSSVLIDVWHYDYCNINFQNAKLIILNDIKVSKEKWFIDLLKEVLNSHQELFVLFHNNGCWTDQRRAIKKSINNHIYSEYYDSRVLDSLYDVELLALAEAFADKNNLKFSEAELLFKSNFISNERKKLRDTLYHPDVLKTIDNFHFSSFITKYLISEANWQEMSEKIKLVHKENVGNRPQRLNRVINEYLRLN